MDSLYLYNKAIIVIPGNFDRRLLSPICHMANNYDSHQRSVSHVLN